MKPRRDPATRWGGALLVGVEVAVLCTVKLGILAATVVYAFSATNPTVVDNPRTATHGDGSETLADAPASQPDLEARSFGQMSWSLATPRLDEQGRLRLIVRDAFGQPVQAVATVTLADGSVVPLTSGVGGIMRSVTRFDSVPTDAVLTLVAQGPSGDRAETTASSPLQSAAVRSERVSHEAGAATPRVTP